MTTPELAAIAPARQSLPRAATSRSGRVARTTRTFDPIGTRTRHPQPAQPHLLRLEASASHDRHRFAGADAHKRPFTGGNFPDNAEVGRPTCHVGAAHRIAVHQALLERRIIPIRREVFGEPQADGLIEPHAHAPGKNSNAIDDFDGLLNGQEFWRRMVGHDRIIASPGIARQPRVNPRNCG